nr:MAG TPA: hypothetical protein [Caudoviricetes sp.]
MSTLQVVGLPLLKFICKAGSVLFDSFRMRLCGFLETNQKHKCKR